MRDCYEPLFSHLGYKALKILAALRFRHVIFFEQQAQDLAQGLARFQEMPDPRAHRIQAEIDPAIQVQYDKLSLKVTVDNTIGDL